MAAPATIEWLAWGEDAFARAAALQRPILLRIGATWCAACRLMAAECDSDTVVVSSVRELYVPVYVDSDRRPEINERYNMGGWPTTAFLTPRGELITGGTYFDVDTLRLLLARVNQNWGERREEVEDAVAAIRRDAEQRRRARPSEEVPSFEHVERVVDLTMDEFDFRYSGFGREPKFAHASSIELLLAEFRRTGEERLREAALMSLEAMWDPGPGRPRLADAAGGFFRYAARRDWTGPRFEMMLDENAHIASVYASAYQLTGETRWAAAVRSVLDFARSTLVSARRRVFRANRSAIGAEAYYALEPAARTATSAPAVDSTAYVAWNAQMASTFVKAGLVLGDDSALEFGAAVVDGLLARARMGDDDLFGHVLTARGPEGPILLASQVYVARALVDCYEALGDPARLEAAAAIMDEVHARLRDSVRLAYTDTIVEPGAEGYLSQPLHPMVENSVAADTLLRLAVLLDAPAFQARALTLLKAVAGSAADYGFVAAPFALAVLRLLTREPLTAIIAGARQSRDARQLVRAAHALYAPFKAVRFLDPERDQARLRALKVNAKGGPVAVLARGASATEPIADADALVSMMARVAAAAFPKR
jgi:uncharacterized protein YyaL (SSP411 family)